MGLPLYRKNPSNQSSQIFICGRCKKSPQCPPNCKNFPFSIFQWSQMFLLPLTLQTSLGQTQSAANSWNLFSTYWTVTGKLLILLLSWKNIYINIYQLGVINVTQNYCAQALYTGILGAYLALLEHHIDKNQDASLLDTSCILALDSQLFDSTVHQRTFSCISYNHAAYYWCFKSWWASSVLILLFIRGILMWKLTIKISISPNYLRLILNKTWTYGLPRIILILKFFFFHGYTLMRKNTGQEVKPLKLWLRMFNWN